jgi:hypothetical protein
MPVENDFLYFATGVGANVVDQATYAAASYISPGLGSGILASAVFNKIVRQGSAGAAMLAQFIVDQLDQAVLDGGDAETLALQLTAAIQQSSTQKPARIVTASTTLTVSLTDWYIGINRSSAPAAINVDLPTGPAVGQEFVFEDLYGNAQAYPITLVPPGGTTFKGGRNSWIIDEDGGAVSVVYAGSDIFGARMT